MINECPKSVLAGALLPPIFTLLMGVEDVDSKVQVCLARAGEEFNAVHRQRAKLLSALYEPFGILRCPQVRNRQ